ncbi:Aste57867_14930 [Aphanomyces stellatus]|uniref:Aste57867_14930 protein n=1 Tax=Aphanomyces stellatus TaxID=120398 RepID=A0A485L4K9_9STRA|nr:hypothetical protein As57867_014874 [Aphanomyces stellatus]VFT91745.1 Aste57867_14930 [Aphanomyces stellatus]
MTALSMCIECEDTEASLSCEECADLYCDLCFQAQHRSGTRAKHTKTPLQAPPTDAAAASPPPAPVVSDATPLAQAPIHQLDDPADDFVMDEATLAKETQLVLRRAKFIPMRLTEAERVQFNLLDAGLNVSEYTDKVDILSYRSPVKRILTELTDLFNIMSGMMVASDFRNGKKKIAGQKYHDNADFFKSVFEIGRRYKIMNPGASSSSSSSAHYLAERMRNNYGKMIYLLQDASMQEIEDHFEFSCIEPTHTVHTFLDAHNALDLLEDADVPLATRSLTDSCSPAQRAVKANAIEAIVSRHASANLTSDAIRLILSSIDDNNSYLALNCNPITRMQELLEKYFTSPAPFSLEIRAGKNGARLSHSHKTQYAYAMQSLSLWKNITLEMFPLWFAVEEDLIHGGGYRLRDTGQGLNRMQRAPHTSHLIHAILAHTQKTSPMAWVGSSVIHLGDHNVPNALMFIDKYTQVSRILSPIVQTCEFVTRMQHDAYIQGMGGAEHVRQSILADFFKHGFDGSGADNFFDAGSCIDGRLTSAWNWCSKIEKKPFYHVFLMAGFVGFDGSFEKLCNPILLCLSSEHGLESRQRRREFDLMPNARTTTQHQSQTRRLQLQQAPLHLPSTAKTTRLASASTPQLKSPWVQQGKPIQLDPLVALDPPRRLSQRPDESQDEAFHRLVDVVTVYLRDENAPEAAAALAAALEHVEQRHYSRLAMRKQHVEELKQLEVALERLEESTDGQRRTFRQRGNQCLHAMSTPLLRHQVDGNLTSLLHDAVVAYKKAGDNRYESIPALEDKIKGDRLYAQATAALEAADDVNAAWQLMTQAAAAYAAYHTSPHFEQCQLMLSLGATDVQWSHQVHRELAECFETRRLDTTRDRFEAAAVASLLHAMDTSKQCAADGNAAAALAHVHRCQRVLQWLTQHGQTTALAACGVTLATIRALETKLHRMNVTHTSAKLTSLSEYELGQVVAQWTQLAATDGELAELLAADALVPSIVAIVTRSPRLAAAHLAATHRLVDVVLHALPPDQAAAWTGTVLKMQCDVATAAPPLASAAALARVVALTTTKPILHHVVQKCRLVDVALALRDVVFGDADTMAAVAAALTHCTVLQPKCFVDDPRAVQLTCALMMRHGSTHARLVADCVAVLAAAFANGTPPAKAGDWQVVACVAQALPAVSSSTIRPLLALVRDLAAQDKRVAAQCRQHRAAFLAVIADDDDSMASLFAAPLT